MGANQGIAGAHPNTGVIFTSAEAARLDAARNTGINVGGMANDTEVVVRQPAVERESADVVFTKALAVAHSDPHGLSKNVEPVVVSNPSALIRSVVDRVTSDAVVRDLIKSAHQSGQAFDPFAETQGGAIAKLKAQVGYGEVGEIFQEGGRSMIRISKVA